VTERLTARDGLATPVIVVLLVICGLLAAGIARAADPTDSILTYGCDPPLPRSAANCSLWHTGPVTLRWTLVDPNFVPVAGSDCDTKTVSTDTTGLNVTCAVVSSNNQVQKIATLRVDKTAPTVTGFTPARPPDYNGWWNHPVTLSFTGTDATSGIGTCDVVDYSGPDSNGAPISGACRDVAGNSAVGSFPINYDSTPPGLAPATSRAVRGRNIVNWTVGADAVQTRVLRSPGIGTAAVSEVYVGRGQTFSDRAVKGGKKYTYSLTAPDGAGNVASTTIALTAWPNPQAAPSSHGVRRLLWKRVRGASYYNVQLYRDGRKILSAWPRGTALQLQRRWTFRGRKYALSPGTYHWYVWPGFGARSAHRYGKLIAHRHFTVSGGKSR
jgi:hypothetical protein